MDGRLEVLLCYQSQEITLEVNCYMKMYTHVCTICAVLCEKRKIK